jgi:very-short-patch-repair endonuclease
MTTITRLRFGEVVDHATLRATGFTNSAIRHAVRAGVLHPRHRGVYAVGRPELSREGRWRAAVLACGPTALLSHAPAALLWQLLERGDERAHVSVPSQNGRVAPLGVTLHRAATLRAHDVATRRGIPVTTVERTLVDLARTGERRALRAAVRQAERMHRLDLAALRDRVATPRTDVGHARLFGLLSAYVTSSGLTDSELEARFVELCARHRLAAPERQVPIGSYRVDFLWREAGLVVETDGRNAHDTDVAFLEDRVRDRALARLGYEVLRFTWAEVTLRPAAVAAEVRAAIRRRRPVAGAVDLSSPGRRYVDSAPH